MERCNIATMQHCHCGSLQQCNNTWVRYRSSNDPGDVMGVCSNNWIDGVIVDEVYVPDVPPGSYVLGWRWDCEQTNQIWQNCADISIV